MNEPNKTTFEDSIQQLEELIRRLEEGELPLAESLEAYKKGIGLFSHCHQLLQKAELEVKELTGTESGQPVLREFE